MQFLLDLVVLVLSSYLALTNGLANTITQLIPDTSSISEEQTLNRSGQSSLSRVASSYESSQTIPDILIQNAAYQKAAVVESIDPAAAPATALEALVNIYCTYTTESYTKTTTGTGFFIDTDGIILTNAHVAQFLLLEGLVGEAQCIIRAGNPATPSYEAELLYISPAWIQEHAKLINDQTPKGTGERDYALLYITSALHSKPMPASFKALPFDTNLLTLDIVGTEVFATGYPAELALAEAFNAPLIPKQATTTIAELMTFGSNYVDLFTIRGTQIGEHGSSGGPVVDARGQAIGIISTKGDDTAFGAGSLRAISLAYIDRSIQQETGLSLLQNLTGNLPYRAQLFKETIVPFLQDALEEEL
jgi:S1-C subfamily serine protease